MQNSLGSLSAGDETDMNSLRGLYEDRLKSIQRQVELFFTELEHDEVYKVVKESKYSKEFSGQRAFELFEVLMRSEQESTIGKLQKMLAEANGKVKRLTWEVQDGESRTKEGQKGKDFEEKMRISGSEMGRSGLGVRTEELLTSEIEYLKKELKIRENSHLDEIAELKKIYEDRVHELEASYETVQGQFSGFQRQSEGLAADHQQVIKKLLEKSKTLKQKILSQKSKIEDLLKTQQKTVENHEKSVEETEDRFHRLQQEASEREIELLSKHRSQTLQLQTHFQELLNRKLFEMQKEVDEQVYKSQEHEHEVRELMEAKLRDIELNFVHKDIHEKTLIEKETEKNNMQERLVIEIERLKKEIEDAQKELEETREELREQIGIGQELESYKQGLEGTLNKTQESLKSLQKEYENEVKNRKNCEKEVKVLENQLDKTKTDLNQALVEIERTKADCQLELMQKINKEDYEKIQEKVVYLNKDLEYRSELVMSLQNEVKYLSNKLAEHSAVRANDIKQLELEKISHQETQAHLFELEDYSQQLLAKLNSCENNAKSAQSTILALKSEIATLHSALENSQQDLQLLKQLFTNKDTENRIWLRLKLESIKKSFKSSVFQLKLLHSDLLQYLEKEVLAFKKTFSSLSQEIYFNLLGALLAHKQSCEQDSEKIRKFYLKKLQTLEESIKREELHWADPETEGVRRAAKVLVDSREMALIENRALKDSIFKVQQENDALYKETQNLHRRFQMTVGPPSEMSLRSPAGILRPRLGSSYKEDFNPYN